MYEKIFINIIFAYANIRIVLISEFNSIGYIKSTTLKIVYKILILQILVFISFGLKAQTMLDYQSYSVGDIRLESPYPMRNIDFNIKLPEDWEIQLKRPQSSGFLSDEGEYGIVFQSFYEGTMTFDVDEFTEKVFMELRRRLDLNVEYVNKSNYRSGTFYGLEYSGEAYFRNERNSMKILIAADMDKILLIAVIYPTHNREASYRMDNIYRSIRLY